MSYNGHYSPVVDLTDDSDSTSRSSQSQPHSHQSDHGPTYVPSSVNPAKRSRIDTTNMNPLALLNPRAFVTNGSPHKSNDRHQEKPQKNPERMPISFNQRIEALHGIKDRKTKAMPTSENKRENNNITEGLDQRRSGTGLLSKNIISGTPSSDVIDLTGSPRFAKSH